MQRIIFLAFCLLIWVLPSPVAAQIDDLVQSRVDIQLTSTQTAAKTTAHLFSSTLADTEYNGVILAGTATGDFSKGYIRFQESGAWGDWQQLTYLSTSTEALFLAGYRSDTYRSGDAFELRFDTPPDAVIDVYDVGVFNNKRDDDAQPYTPQPAQKSEPGQQISETATIRPPRLINRNAWGAEPFIGDPVPLANPSYNRMTFHHAACCDATTYEEGLAQVKSIQDFHQDVRGWSDIGYHFLFDKQGRVYQGRPFMDNRTNLSSPPVLAMGAHVGGANTGNIGVSLLGCFHPPEGSNCQDEMSPALRDSVITLYAYLSERYRVSTTNLFGHRDQGTTSCPGDNNYALLPELRTQIDELVLSGNQPIAFASLTAELAQDGVVQLNWEFTEVIDVTSYRIERETGESTEVMLESSLSSDINSIVDASAPADEPVFYSLFATSSDGLVQRLALASAEVNGLNEMQLGQSFPNPASFGATIRYYVDQEGIVTINLYDALGRRMQTLVDEFKDGDQWYTVELNTSNLAQGTYYYHMQVEGFSSIIFDETRTLIVLRESARIR